MIYKGGAYTQSPQLSPWSPSLFIVCIHDRVLICSEKKTPEVYLFHVYLQHDSRC